MKRPAMYDPHPNSAFSPLPPAFGLSRNARKEQAVAGQEAELDQILQPEYKTSQHDPESASIAGPSRSATTRTSGGFAATKRRDKVAGLGLRSSASLSSFKHGSNSATSGRVGGIYIDSNGKVHDTEFDPFGGVAEMSRRKSRRKSAFGSDRRKGSGSETSSASGSEVAFTNQRKSVDNGADEEEIRRRLEVERRRLDEVSGLAAARRKSMLSDRASGRATPSIRSSEDGLTSVASTRYDGATYRSRSQQGHYVPSPLSPTFGVHPNGHPAYATRTLSSATALESAIEESPPQKSTERTNAPVRERRETPNTISVTDKKITITGFDAPHSARPLTPRPETPSHLISPFENLRVPDSGRLSSSSRRSSESTRQKPPEPPREDLYPETPAQLKMRQERERRAGRAGVTSKSRAGSLAVDTALSQSNGRGRALPEIEIVEDDDPRIIFPEGGKSTRVQTVHDHVIRGPFSLALNAQSAQNSAGLGRRASADQSAKSIRSITGGGSASIAPSTIIDQGQGGYLPSRWASGDKQLRITEDEKERYRPREWGGKTGDLGGRSEEWRWVFALSGLVYILIIQPDSQRGDQAEYQGYFHCGEIWNVQSKEEIVAKSRHVRRSCGCLSEVCKGVRKGLYCPGP